MMRIPAIQSDDDCHKHPSPVASRQFVVRALWRRVHVETSRSLSTLHVSGGIKTMDGSSLGVMTVVDTLSLEEVVT